ncbi:thiamine biosynthesis protein [Nitrosopumilus sp.]|uniref:thiamine biosynthesis protein n=1 Tax=Nitrosopumilus sp. TaxID=2024843 RepID=UPI002616A1F2|nr:thiamine biosynthesis protein [Nitrosopumilus sp.]
MNETAYVIVFPTIFSRNKIPQLISNIKKILKIKNQEFKSVKRDGDIILVDANDPVFVSSAINLLFGIKKTAIARQVKNDFKIINSEITSIGGNLLLKGEKFLVKVEGTSIGFLTKDIEIAVTSNIIEQKSNLGAQPGTDGKYDKLLYTYLTKNNAYICIFIDEGNGGIPFEEQKKKTVCAVFDEISAISCYETIKQGYDTRIIICYRQKTELMNLIKYINQIIPRLIKSTIDIEFFNLKINPSGNKNYLIYLNSILEILLKQRESRISLSLSPLIFSSEFIENSVLKIFSVKKLPILPLEGIDMQLFQSARELGFENNFKKLEKIIGINTDKIPQISKKIIDDSIKTKKIISVTVGPNNVHDILDALETDH